MIGLLVGGVFLMGLLVMAVSSRVSFPGRRRGHAGGDVPLSTRLLLPFQAGVDEGKAAA